MTTALQSSGTDTSLQGQRIFVSGLSKKLNTSITENTALVSDSETVNKSKKPVKLPTVTTTAFTVETPEIPMTLVKKAGDNSYVIPHEAKELTSLLAELMSIEQSNNPSWKDYNVYLTIENGKHLHPVPTNELAQDTNLIRNYIVSADWNPLMKLESENLLRLEESTVYFFDSRSTHPKPVSDRLKGLFLRLTYSIKEI